MDVKIRKNISDIFLTTTKATATTTTTTTTGTSATAGRTRNFIKKKRKIYLNRVCDMLKANKETMANSAKCDSTALSAAATTSQMLNSTTTTTCAALEKGDAVDGTLVCLICRQHIKECCQRCCQQHERAITKTTETTSTDNNNSSRFSLINRPRQAVDNHNSNHNKNYNNTNINKISNNNYSSCSHSTNLTIAIKAAATTTMTTTATSNCSCLQHNSSCAATSSNTTTTTAATSKLASTTTTTSASSSPPSTTTTTTMTSSTTALSCLCNVRSCKTSSNNSSNNNNNNESATFVSCSCLSSKTTNRAAAATTTTAAATSSLSSLSLSPPATNPTHQQSHSGTNDKHQITLATATTTDRSSSFAVSLFRNALRTFQCLILLIQMQFMRPIYNNKPNNKNNDTNYNNYNKNNSNNNNSNTNKNKRQQQQQCPPLPRLKFRRNSYCYNATNINLNNNKNASLKHQQQVSTLTAAAPHNKQHPKHHQQHLHSQHHQQQQQQPQQHHHPQQQQQLSRGPVPPQHFRYCKMPNLSPLYMILIVLSFLSLFLPSTHASVQTSLMAPPLTLPTLPSTSSSASTASQVRLSRTETVCKSLDIRNTISAFRQLRNCTVIEGFLLITLVNTHSQSEFDETYPLLTEVTEFILVYRIHALRSLSQIFPNLSVIRGRALHDGYALIIYSNPHLEDLGLPKLTISRGGVRIQDNLLLCFVDTIDWTRVVANGTDNVIIQNRALIECPRCPGEAKYDDAGLLTPPSKNELTCNEYHGRRHCWSSKACQKICPDNCRDNCIDENTCCNENCVGGCSPTNPNECSSCRHYSIYSNMCTDKCPSNYYSYLDRRCLTSDDCTKIGTKYEIDKQEILVPYDGMCTTRCPEGYTKIDGKCTQCDGKCVQLCPGGLIDSVARAKQYHGCTHIGREGLIISIKRGGRHLMEELAYGLSSIEVIDTYLKVHRTIGMFSLGFFKNLRVINGTKLCEEKFALYVLENNDLETLWNPKQEVYINEGRVFFHFNPKLCYSVIDALRPNLRNNATFDKNEVATDSNGYKGSCNTEFLNITVESTGSVVALVKIENPLVWEDERTFIGYQYFIIEDEFMNQTKHEHRPCDDGWSASEPTKEDQYLFTDLAPYKVYAFYVKTMTISSEPRNAQSPIMYLKTKSSQPTYVEKLTGYANSSSQIIISWERPAQSHGNLTKYKVTARLDRRNDNIQLGTRNYCKDPLKEAAKTDVSVIKTSSTEKPETAADCKCRKETNIYDEDVEASIHGNIEFENSIQNFVYVKDTRAASNASKAKKENEEEEDDELPELIKKKRSRRSRETDFGDSFLFRHMRALPDESPDVVAGSTESFISTSATPLETAKQLDNETIWNVNGNYFELFFDSVNASIKSYVFENLKHFSTYMLGVEACREHELGASDKVCSRIQTMFVRTQALDNVDRVENFRAELETTNSSRSNIRLHWDPPKRPNGAVVSYTISYLIKAQDAVEEKKCITALDYQNRTNGYPLPVLPTGNYSIKVRANTLAGEGLYTKIRFIEIPPTRISSGIIALIVISIIILLSIIGGVFYYMRQKLLEPPSDLKIFPTVNPFYISLQYIPDDWEVTRDRVIHLSPLGQGSFGMVYEGIMKHYNGTADDVPCAIKTVNENATDRERMNFLNEASVMKQFDTYHVVRLLGVCSRGQPALVVMELMKNGDLKSYLRAHRPDDRDDVLGNLGLMMAARGIGGGDSLTQPPPLSRIYQMALEIADGMAYLSAKKFVHRDLAARNCMVAADLTVKIGDFGMTRDIYETDYYRKGTKGLLPVRWMPPESLRDGIYSSCSDIFSYGVVLWEMATLASQPYQGLSNDQVLRYVIDGGVMERPENCPDRLYRLMHKCWHHRPTARPTFMNIIEFMLDCADPNFRQVSFYHSADGAAARQKELNENKKTSTEIFGDNDNDMDDVTTPLRAGEFNPYNLNMDNNSSVENHESPTNSPFSVPVLIPGFDNESSHHVHTPSTSGGAAGSGINLPAPPSLPRPLTTYRQRQQSQKSAEEEAPYVLPDYGMDDGPSTSAAARARATATAAVTAATSNAARSADTDERGYQIYDPSPNYRTQVPYVNTGHEDDDDDEEDFASGSSTRHRLSTVGSSGAQNLLPRTKGGARAMPVIMPMSQSMPDEPTGTSAPTMSSSLHPSTASAASSNASSATPTSGGGKIPSLKRAVADMMPARLRNINRRIFSNHKRSGSTASHASSSSNPNTASSSTNLTSGTSGSGRGQSVSGQNLGTIESGGSGSAGSYVTAPRFFTPAPVAGRPDTGSTSDNPNYKLLDETPNTSYITAATIENASPARTTSGFTTSTNPNYQLLDESVVSAASPRRSPGAAATTHTSENPNYELMQAPAQSSDNPNYVVMSPPEPEAPAFGQLSENPNYQMMGAPPSAAPTAAAIIPSSSQISTQPFSTLSAALRREKSRDRFHNSATPSSNSSPNDPDEDDDEHMEHIEMERMPLSRPKSSGSGSRSRSQSQTRGGGDESRTGTPTSNTVTPSAAAAPSSSSSQSNDTQPPPTTFSLKERWLRQQQQQQAQQPPKPPPNGFLGRES